MSEPTEGEQQQLAFLDLERAYWTARREALTNESLRIIADRHIERIDAEEEVLRRQIASRWSWS